jgi:hypothetical protein
MTFTMARQVLVQMARSFHVEPSRYTGGDRLDQTGFRHLKRELAEAGVEFDNEMEEMLAALRATYEPLLDGLARYLMLSLPGWSTDRTARDHWTRGPRGTLARRLIDELSEGTIERPATTAMSARATRWRRLRTRLRPD